MDDYGDQMEEENDQAMTDDTELDPCPTIKVSQEEFEEWCSPWKRALVIHVLGKRVSFKALENKVNRDWVKSGSMRMIDMPNDFYLVQFTEEEDYRHALYEGPWMIADHYILVQRWRPFFTLTATQTRKVAAWIRIPGLPIELYNDRFLWRVGSKLGTMLKIDKLTSIHSRGKFARICVEVNLNRRLVSMINVMGHIIRLEYEGLHSICFNCGKYGHKQDQCDVRLGAPKPTTSEAVQKGAGSMVADTSEPSADPKEMQSRGSLKSVSEQENLVVTRKFEQDNDNLYGPWMIVKRGKNSGKIRSAPLIKGGLSLPHNVPEVKVTNKNDEPSSVGEDPWFCTFVYVSPHPQGRIPLWRDISRLASLVDGAWLVMGDFNAVLQPHERERLNGITTKLLQGPNRFLEKLQMELWTELDEILKREEIIWFQKSRCKWLRMGDKNTRVFHGTTIARRRRNKVFKLLNENGDWMEQPAELERMVTTFYRTLFTDERHMEPFSLTNAFPRLNEDELSTLETPISNGEIHNAVKSMSGFKAPGPDGLQAVFFKSQWDIVGNAVCKLIHEIEAVPSRVADINETLIVLVPKTENVSSLKQMWPISLCNVSYKILTKVLANRLRQVMEKLVHPNQCSFIPNRQSKDNIIIFQEVIHSMRYKSRAKGWMAFKIDLEKAYDRLKWDFVKDTLLDIGLPAQLVNIIWACISSPRMRMLWNGETLDEFLPSRDVRQGDPISPYLFVLCIERLFQLITKEVEAKRWKPIRLAKDGPPLSHLAFADDLILFSEASMNQAEIIRDCLDRFCASSGQKVSLEKTKIFFSKNVAHTVRDDISSGLGFQRTNNLGKYLGIPAHHSRVCRRDYQNVINCVNKRLSGWKASTLSFAGRLTLCKSVIEAIPSYTSKQFDKLCMSFLWGDSPTSRKIHAISWKTICMPKDQGGLGLRSMRTVNNSFMMKNGWSLITEPNKL
uniref:Retrovirus-related Pol polyprotein LINE-1 n=1 Tax=Cajanus cajan TaxID=3821 RepID=A0A151TS47_CAJCA|nr:Retrovirus-related Pol polyprotein LINE-1 [Cajanus cajan]